MYWLEFFISAIVIVFSGMRLTAYADKLSDKLKLDKLWVGFILLALITSLPELVTSFVSILIVKSVDMGVGNILGSNMLNIFLIFIIDIFYLGGAVTNDINLNKKDNLSIGIIMVLSVTVFLGILLYKCGFEAGYIKIGLTSIIVMGMYLLAMKHLSKAEIRNKEKDSRNIKENLFIIWLNIIICAVIIVLAAIKLVNSADIIAIKTGLGKTFVGSLLLAFVTSLPEMVVSLSALKIAALDMAMGNILGSNLMNLLVLGLCDILYGGGLLQDVSSVQMISAIGGCILISVLFIGMKVKGKKSFLGLGWDSWLIAFLFFSGMKILYQFRG